MGEIVVENVSFFKGNGDLCWLDDALLREQKRYVMVCPQDAKGCQQSVLRYSFILRRRRSRIEQVLSVRCNRILERCKAATREEDPYAFNILKS